MMTWAIPLASLIISMATLIFATVSLRHKADGDYVQQIERRVKQLEVDLEECNRRREVLQAENIELMRKLVAGGKK